jgi:non-ribosomal peptide synthetase component F
LVFDGLEFVYLPSRDVAADLEHFTDQVGAELVFAIEAFGTRVAMVRLSPDPPALLLAGHLTGEQPVLVHRVADLAEAVAELEDRGVEIGPRFEIPYGPGVELVSPGPQRLALYELTRPEATERLANRRDF